jgi:hypothetical protein
MLIDNVYAKDTSAFGVEVAQEQPQPAGGGLFLPQHAQANVRIQFDPLLAPLSRLFAGCGRLFC